MDCSRGCARASNPPKRSLKMPSLYNHALTDQCPQICIFYQFKTGMVTYLNVQIMIPFETVIDLKWLILLKW